MAKRMSKAEYVQHKKIQKKVLEGKLDSFLKAAIETRKGLDELVAHYRISGLYGYSFFNSILIKMQGGTIAQSYNKWKKLDRTVIKGTKASINIFRPMFKKEKQADGTEEQKLIGFKLAPVFNITQTEGKELEYDHNTDEAMDIPYDRVSSVIAKLTKAPVVEEFTGNARGYSDGRRLVVSSISNDVDKTKTLIHEAAHHMLHTKDLNISRSGAEVEAEATAALVMSYLGLDFELSKSYVNNWKSGIVDARSGMIIRTADKIIKALKKDMTEDEKFLVGLSN